MPLRSVSAWNDEPLLSRSRFYKRILEDLKERADQGEVPRETSEVIRTFYREQVAKIDGTIAEQERARRLHDLMCAARQSAHHGLFQNAIDQFSQGMAEDAAAYPWKELIAEVTAKKEQRERELEVSRQVNALIAEADHCVVSSRLEDAIEILERAQQIDAANKPVQMRLARAQSMIAKQRAHSAQQRQGPEGSDKPEVGVDEAASTEVSGTEASGPQADEEIVVAELAPEPSEPVVATFAENQDDIPSPHRRWIEAASHWSSILKPFLLDNVGWFVGAFMVVAGFVVLIFTFWGTIEQNRILMQSLVFLALAVATGMFFSLAYFMRLKYPQLETSSNVLLVIVALLIPLVFAAAALTSLVPATPPELTRIHRSDRVFAELPDPGRPEFLAVTQTQKSRGN